MVSPLYFIKNTTMRNIKRDEMLHPDDVCYNVLFLQLAESMYEYGKGNPEEAFNVLGASFDTLQLKVW